MPVFTVHAHRGRELFKRQLGSGGEYTAPPLHQAGVPRDAEYPRPHALRLAKLVEALEDPEQRFLRDLLGVLALAAHQPAIPKQLRAEVLDEALERLFAACR